MQILTIPDWMKFGKGKWNHTAASSQKLIGIKYSSGSKKSHPFMRAIKQSFWNFFPLTCVYCNCLIAIVD